MAWLCSEANMPGTPGVTEHLQFSSHPPLKPFLKLAGGTLASRMVSGFTQQERFSQLSIRDPTPSFRRWRELARPRAGGTTLRRRTVRGANLQETKGTPSTCALAAITSECEKSHCPMAGPRLQLPPPDPTARRPGTR